MGRNPKLKIIQTTHTAELSYRFGRKVRNLMEESSFQDIFDDIKLSQDSNAAGRGETNKGESISQQELVEPSQVGVQIY